MLDPNLNTTQYSYADSYTSGTPPGNTNAYLTKITRPMTNGINHISSYSYGYADGQLTVAKDENGQSTSYTYSDPLDRLTQITYPTGGGETIYTYNDTPPTPSVTTKKELSSGSFLTTVNTMDGMGHRTQTQVTSDPAGTDLTVTKYDGLGRTLSVTNPYRTTSDPTYGVTTYAYDSLGRLATVTNPDSSTVQTTYAGRATEVTDEGNGTRSVQRISQSDALGRLTSVCEVSSTTLTFGASNAPAACGQDIGATGFLTSYQYDPLGNLLSVSQGGLNARSFAYDSLSRLTSSTNPESGAISYSYDANGNLTSKIAPKPNQTSSSVTVTTTNQYDSLNRIISKSYNDGATPTANFAYDTCPTGGCPSGYPSTPNSVGRLVDSSVSNAATFESYDPMGRTAGEWQCTPQNCGSSYFSLAYTYDLLGDVLSSSNGASVTLSYTYNAIAQLTQLTSSLNNASHLATLFSTPTYNAPGLLTADKLGNGISETRVYNSRLRPTSIADGATYTVALTYAPNGNMVTATDSVNGTWNYGTNSAGLNGYDDFNRLLLATSGSNAYSYLYDRYGNRWEQLLNSSCTAGTASCLTFDANNHESNGLLSYDAAGNVISDNVHLYSYDAENRLINVDSGATATYVYDANGRRVRKTNAGINYDYLYDLGGHVVTVYTGGWARGEIYIGNRHLATYTNDTTYFAHADWLGTERARTTVAGAIYETCTSLPFGDNLQCSTTDPSPLHFTGQERDSESGLDNFVARYDSSGFGRFMSPDPENDSGFEHQDDPQSWNGYSYARNNPLLYTDPRGNVFQICDNSGHCQTLSDVRFGNDFQINPNVELIGGYIYIKDINGDFQLEGTFRQTSVDDAIGGQGSDVLGEALIGAAAGGVVNAGRAFFGGLLGSAARETTAGVIAGEATRAGEATFQDLLRGTVEDASGQPTKSGGFAQATKDFEALAGKSQNLGRVQMKELPDGGKAVLRNFSKDTRPTLEYQPGSGGSKTEWIRYNP